MNKMAPSVSVAEYFAGKNVLITGATGFVGKALVEKLLRSCQAVGKIYMLMRPKHGQSVRERLNKFLECPIFDNLRVNSPGSLDKLRAVSGDTTVDGLAICDEDRDEVQRECNVVFHAAACVRFDLPLGEALNQNTRATKRVLELADGIKNLEVFLHMSTSYCQHPDMVLEERLYPTEEPQRIMELVNWMPADILNDIQPKLIHPHGNTYAYTKALSETVVSQYSGRFPIAIGRLSIVTASISEPMPGWIDNINGPTGFIIAAGKGVIRSMICHEEILIDGIPLDLAVNACILLAYLTAVEKPQDVRVCNVTQSGHNAKSWIDSVEIGIKLLEDYPFSQILWVPGGTAKRSRLHHDIVAFFLHFLPAYFIDLLLHLLGKKTFMMKVYDRIKNGINILEYYTTNEWKFVNNYFRNLKNKISKEDDETFYTDFDLLQWDSYMKNYILGIQKYIMKEDPADRPRAKRMNRIVLYIDYVLRFAFYSLLIYAAYRLVNTLIH